MKSLPGFEQYVIARYSKLHDSAVYFVGHVIGSYGRDIPHFRLDKRKAEIFTSKEAAEQHKIGFGDRYWIEEY